jgi:hypothetical protein
MSAQAIGRTMGVLYLITFITSIPALALYQPVLDDPVRYVTGGGGSDNQIYLAVFLELILVIANVGTAVVPYPVFRRHNEILALGYVAARIWECLFISVGIIAMVTIVTLGQETSDSGSIAYALAALKDWTMVLGPGFVVGVGNGLILGWIMYRSGLVPRGLAILGLIGGPLIIISGVAVLFDVIDPGDTAQAFFTIPEFLWELGLGLYLTVYGFRNVPVLDGWPTSRQVTAAAPA